MSEKEMLDSIKTREELRRRGYRQKTCETCKGTGHSDSLHRCFSCDGKGYKWKSPIMR